jgi:hypothetical protein
VPYNSKNILRKLLVGRYFTQLGKLHGAAHFAHDALGCQSDSLACFFTDANGADLQAAPKDAPEGKPMEYAKLQGKGGLQIRLGGQSQLPPNSKVWPLSKKLPDGSDHKKY